jgi:hypothetical protein
MPGSPSPRGPHTDTCGGATGGMQLGSCRGQIAHVALGLWRRKSHEFSIYRAGGTGIEPATCGFGDPIRRVVRCRVVSLRAALPHALCRLMSLNVAGCRRSLGQILGQPMLLRAFFSPLSSSRSAAVTPDGWSDPTAVPRRANAFSASRVATNSQGYAPVTVPNCCVPSACLAGGFAGSPSTANFASSVSPDASENRFRSVVT